MNSYCKIQVYDVSVTPKDVIVTSGWYEEGKFTELVEGNKPRIKKLETTGGSAIGAGFPRDRIVVSIDDFVVGSAFLTESLEPYIKFENPQINS